MVVRAKHFPATSMIDLSGSAGNSDSPRIEPSAKARCWELNDKSNKFAVGPECSDGTGYACSSFWILELAGSETGTKVYARRNGGNRRRNVCKDSSLSRGRR